MIEKSGVKVCEHIDQSVFESYSSFSNVTLFS